MLARDAPDLAAEERETLLSAPSDRLGVYAGLVRENQTAMLRFAARSTVAAIVRFCGASEAEVARATLLDTPRRTGRVRELTARLLDHLAGPGRPWVERCPPVLDLARLEHAQTEVFYGPDESGPDESGPDESGPDESAPDESAPDESAPDESAPDESAPDENAPDGSAPDAGAPDERASDETASDGSVPTGRGPAPSGGARPRAATLDRAAFLQALGTCTVEEALALRARAPASTRAVTLDHDVLPWRDAWFSSAVWPEPPPRADPALTALCARDPSSLQPTWHVVDAALPAVLGPPGGPWGSLERVAERWVAATGRDPEAEATAAEFFDATAAWVASGLLAVARGPGTPPESLPSSR